MNHSKSKLKNDFDDFNSSNSAAPSEYLDNKILSFVKEELSISHKIVFAKLLAIQSFIGFMTLAFCPQFNFSLTNNNQLFHFFHHRFGESICMAICGSIFIGSGAIFSAYILNIGEIRKIRESKFLYFVSVSIIALSAFFLLGTQVYLSLAMFWLVGASIGGLVAFEFNIIIRKQLFS